MSFFINKGNFKLAVESGKTYMLRLINAALNEELFFKIAGHRFTVVEVDAVYVKPFNTDTILIAPGQTTTALVSAARPSGQYLIAAAPFQDSAVVAVDNRTATATVHYSGTLSATPTKTTSPPPQNATSVANTFVNSLRSLNSKTYPANVPITVDHYFIFTFGLVINLFHSCNAGKFSRVVAAINNITFKMPKTALLQAHYFNLTGIYTTDFPAKPRRVFDFTGKPPSNLATMKATKLYKLPYNSTVQVVLQDTGNVAPENHPIHLHGFNFFVVGLGTGNYNSKKDSNKFNLVDPVERNTVGVPSGGWAAIRFRADNPGFYLIILVHNIYNFCIVIYIFQFVTMTI